MHQHQVEIKWQKLAREAKLAEAGILDRFLNYSESHVSCCCNELLK